MKGNTKIILTNVETGEQEIHEDENLITNALDKLININVGMGNGLNSYILPFGTQALGGLMLFDGELTEDPENYHFPTEAHLVGYANRELNATDKYRGSYNSIESYDTQTEAGCTQVCVWDFGTSQANGTIRSVARTSNYAGKCPTRYYGHQSYINMTAGCPSGDQNWYPIRYENGYLYMLKPNATTHEMRLARVQCALSGCGCLDYSGKGRTYEVIASWNTELTTYSYYTNSAHTATANYTVYADNISLYEDGHDGYLYCMAYGPANRDYGTTYDYDITYFTINYGDGSYDKSETVRLRSGTGYNAGSDVNYMYWANRVGGHVYQGVLYRRNGKHIYRIPLNNVAAYTAVQVLDNETSDYIVNLGWVQFHNGGFVFEVYHYTTTSYNRMSGIFYPDCTWVLPTYSYQGQEGYRPEYWCYDNEDLVLAWYYGGFNVRVSWTPLYLGTINNLSSPITKTAAQTMKIIYTLTDIGEEEDQGDGGE